MKDGISLFCSFCKSMPPPEQFCIWLMKNYMKENLQLSGSLDEELHHSDASVLVDSKWKMSLTRAAQFTWLSPSQD